MTSHIQTTVEEIYKKVKTDVSMPAMGSTLTQQPEASWRKEFDDYSPELSKLLSEDVSKAIKSFIERAVKEELEAERKKNQDMLTNAWILAAKEERRRIEEAVKGMKIPLSDEKDHLPNVYRHLKGKNEAFDNVLSLIHPQE